MTRTGIVLTTSAVTVGIALTAFIDVPKKLIWNASASVPLGLYKITPVNHLRVGDRVTIDPPELLASFLAERGYLPRGVPLLKTIAAVPGQRVCRIGSTIIIDGKAVGEAHDCDRLGRGLPVWQGCRSIGADELFLMNTLVADSLDGRYFGTTPITAVIGKALPIWTNEVGRGPLDNPNTQSPTTTTSTKEYRP